MSSSTQHLLFSGAPESLSNGSSLSTSSISCECKNVKSGSVRIRSVRAARSRAVRLSTVSEWSAAVGYSLMADRPVKFCVEPCIVIVALPVRRTY